MHVFTDLSISFEAIFQIRVLFKRVQFHRLGDSFVIKLSDQDTIDIDSKCSIDNIQLCMSPISPFIVQRF